MGIWTLILILGEWFWKHISWRNRRPVASKVARNLSRFNLLLFEPGIFCECHVLVWRWLVGYPGIPFFERHRNAMSRDGLGWGDGNVTWECVGVCIFLLLLRSCFQLILPSAWPVVWFNSMTNCLFSHPAAPKDFAASVIERISSTSLGAWQLHCLVRWGIYGIHYVRDAHHFPLWKWHEMAIRLMDLFPCQRHLHKPWHVFWMGASWMAIAMRETTQRGDCQQIIRKIQEDWGKVWWRNVYYRL